MHDCLRAGFYGLKKKDAPLNSHDKVAQLFDFKKLDIFFAEDSLKKQRGDNSPASRRTHVVRLIKLDCRQLLPLWRDCWFLPGLQERSGELQMNIAKPKDGELEKLHMEKYRFL